MDFTTFDNWTTWIYDNHVADENGRMYSSPAQNRLLVTRTTQTAILQWKSVAIQLLTHEDSALNKVVDRVGLQSSSHSSRVFKKEYGKSPLRFMQSFKKV